VAAAEVHWAAPGVVPVAAAMAGLWGW
jgi:hypothetical protein